jgi:hypothetical protein
MKNRKSETLIFYSQNFALDEAAEVLTMLVQRFDRQLAPGEEVRPLLRVTFRPNMVSLVMKEKV